MSDRLFESPVFGKDRPLFCSRNCPHGDALDFLYDWPKHDQDLIYEIVWKACCDSHDGVKTAESAIRGSAKERGILDDPEIAIPWMSSKKSGGGRVQVEE